MLFPLAITLQKNIIQILAFFLLFTCGLVLYASKSTLFSVQVHVVNPEYKNTANLKNTNVNLNDENNAYLKDTITTEMIQNNKENNGDLSVEDILKEEENSGTTLDSKDTSNQSSKLLLDGQEISFTDGVPNVLLPEKKTFLPNFRNPCWYERNLENQKILKCLPYFFLAGMPKCGTTDLFSMLVKHPVIEHTRKEPHWWTRKRFGNYKRKYEIIDSQPLEKYIQKFEWNINRIDEYMVKKVGNSSSSFYHHFIMGDGSASTFWDMKYWTSQVSLTSEEPTFVTANIFKQLLPNVKIIVILRNPVDRAYSEYLYFTGGNKSPEEFHQGVVTVTNKLNECALTYGKRTCAYVKQNDSSVGMIRLQIGMYHVFLEDWQKVFPPNQLMVIRLEDYTLQRPQFLQEIAHFLEIEPYPQDTIAKMEKERIANQRNKKDRKIGEMLPKTRLLLEEFYQPFNDRLAEILKDDKYKWR